MLFGIRRIWAAVYFDHLSGPILQQKGLEVKYSEVIVAEPRIHIVLVEPEIPQNTGNIGRTCVGLGARLHLVGDLGFSLDQRELKRAGLDYWPSLDWRRNKSWESILSTLPSDSDLSFFSTKGQVSFWDKKYTSPSFLIFGSESRGFPAGFYREYKNLLVRIPTGPGIRSLNLATAAGVASFEAARQLDAVPSRV